MSCKNIAICQTHSHSCPYSHLNRNLADGVKNNNRVRTVKIYGSDTMLGWFKLRMERYSHFIFNFNEQPDIKSTFID